MEQEQVQNHWIPLPLEEEEEEGEEIQDTSSALQGRKTLQLKKETTIFTGASSSSDSDSPSSTISNDNGNGVFIASVEEEPLILKEEEGVKEAPVLEKGEEKVEDIIGNVENGNHVNDDEHEAVGLGLVAEFVGDATNEEVIHCTTTTTTSIGVAASHNNNSVYFDKQQGNEVNGLKGVQNGDGARSVVLKSQGEGKFEIQAQNGLHDEVNQRNKVPSNSYSSPLRDSFAVQAATAENFGIGSSAKAIPSLIEEIDQQLVDYNVEAVLEKQETHDLFCPNCKSCITKRVILKKRKRTPKLLESETKPDKPDTKRVNSFAPDASQGGQAIETPGVDNQVGHATPTPVVGSQVPPADTDDPESEPELFRCSTCLSFFIALRNGLFPCFRVPSEPNISQPLIPASNSENPSNVAAPRANWFISLFTKKGKPASEQGEASVENSGAGPAEQNHSSSTSTDMQTSLNGHPEGPSADTDIKNVELEPDTKTKDGGVSSLISSLVEWDTIEAGTENGIKSSIASGNEPLADQKYLNSPIHNDSSSIQSGAHNSSNVMNGLQRAGEDVTDSSAKEHLQAGNVKTDEGGKKNDSTNIIKTDIVADKPPRSFPGDMVTTSDSPPSRTPASTEWSVIHKTPQKDVDKTPGISQNGYSSLVPEAPSPAQTLVSAVVASGTGASKSSTPSQTADNVPVQGAIVTGPHTQIDIEEQPRPDMGEPLKWEILKSIVYGGLVESITSLGIVSSAAASGAAPLNIVAMGFANLIGGLFIIFHNLIELRNDQPRGDSQEVNAQEDRYQVQLGRRANFPLHIVVAILSFLIFGAVPIIVYLLLINKNYYPEVKLAAVAVTSVVCVILLAIGKVYTKRPPKSYTTTLLQYVTMAIATAGVSYIAGGLLDRLLEQLNGPESGFVLTMPSSGTKSGEPAWMSY